VLEITIKIVLKKISKIFNGRCNMSGCDGCDCGGGGGEANGGGQDNYTAYPNSSYSSDSSDTYTRKSSGDGKGCLRFLLILVIAFGMIIGGIVLAFHLWNGYPIIISVAGIPVALIVDRLI
jgi:hypothetical protein